MLHVYAAKFDMTTNQKKFAKFFWTKQALVRESKFYS